MMKKACVRTADAGGSPGLAGTGTHETCASRQEQSNSTFPMYDIETTPVCKTEFETSRKVLLWLTST